MAKSSTSWLHAYSYDKPSPSVAQRKLGKAAMDDSPNMSELQKILSQKPTKKSGSTSALVQSLSKRKGK